MKLEQQQRHEQQHILIRFVTFLRERDAKIIELFFFALNAYIFALVVLPPHSYIGFALTLRIVFQLCVTGINAAALIQGNKKVRIASSIANTAIMGLVSTSLVRTGSPHAGTYILLIFLAMFVCWKINVRQ